MNGDLLTLGAVAALAAASLGRRGSRAALPRAPEGYPLLPSREAYLALPFEHALMLTGWIRDWDRFQFHPIWIDPADPSLRTEEYDRASVRQYTARMVAGDVDELPEIVVLERWVCLDKWCDDVGPKVEIIDGNHRVASARLAKLPKIRALVGRKIPGSPFVSMEVESEDPILKSLGTWWDPAWEKQ
jgi:hypothetical protein